MKAYPTEADKRKLEEERRRRETTDTVYTPPIVTDVSDYGSCDSGSSDSGGGDCGGGGD